jgi:predicted RNA polymerase sigma factor
VTCPTASPVVGRHAEAAAAYRRAVALSPNPVQRSLLDGRLRSVHGP